MQSHPATSGGLIAHTYHVMDKKSITWTGVQTYQKTNRLSTWANRVALIAWHVITVPLPLPPSPEGHLWNEHFSLNQDAMSGSSCNQFQLHLNAVKWWWKLKTRVGLSMLTETHISIDSFSKLLVTMGLCTDQTTCLFHTLSRKLSQRFEVMTVLVHREMHINFNYPLKGGHFL